MRASGNRAAGLFTHAALRALAASAWSGVVRAATASASCVLSRHDHTVPLERGVCQWSQRQGNVSIRIKGWSSRIKGWAFAFPSAEEGRTYSRLNREGPEAAPLFSREGRSTLSVYWRRPAGEPGGQ